MVNKVEILFFINNNKYHSNFKYANNLKNEYILPKLGHFGQNMWFLCNTAPIKGLKPKSL